MGVIYNLEFLGLRPSFRIKIRAEYKRVYETLEAELNRHDSLADLEAAARRDGAGGLASIQAVGPALLQTLLERSAAAKAAVEAAVSAFGG